MNMGMMWSFDKPMAGLVVNLAEAVKYYQEKFAALPNMCMAHPQEVAALEKVTGARNLGNGRWQVGAVEVRAMKEVLLKNLWIGVEERV
jgi:hypothetical protein